MSDPVDPDKAPAPPGRDDHDDLIGFASPGALAGRAVRPPEPEPAPLPETLPEPLPAAEPVVTSAPDPDLFDEPAPRPLPEARRPEPVAQPPLPAAEPYRSEPEIQPELQPEPLPYRAAPAPSSAASFGRARPARSVVVEGATGLYAIYILLLLAVPTFGVSALLALVAVYGRAAPADKLAGGHHLFQKRTLTAGAVVAVAGAILVVVNIGVFVLFLLALWLMARGAFGVLRLQSGRPIDNPRGWLF